MQALNLTAQLINFNSTNPPGNESQISLFLQSMLETYGFKIDCFEFSEGRPSFIATMDGTDASLEPVVFAGHIDVVPPGKKKWQSDPFTATIRDDKIFGRGSTDMKSGIACFISAIIKIIESSNFLTRGIKIIIVSGEETGCQGSFHLKELGVLGSAHLLIVAEPTNNFPVVAHKGSIRMIVRVSGKSAHSAMPEEGKNAIFAIIPLMLELEGHKFENHPHPILGYTTSVVTTVNAGQNINSIPDLAECSVDIRTIPSTPHSEIISKLKELIGSNGTFEVINNFDGFSSDPDNPTIKQVVDIIEEVSVTKSRIGGAAYYTDASALFPGLGCPPTIVLGPGLPELCHKTDEYCPVNNIETTTKIFEKIIEKVCFK